MKNTIAYIGYVVGTIVLAVSFYSYHLTHEEYENFHQSIKKQTEILSVNADLLKDIVDAETGQRGYLLTLDKSYLEPYNDGVKYTYETIEEFKVLLQSDEELVKTLEDIKLLVDDKFKELEQTIQLASTDYDKAIEIVKSNHGKDTMDTIRMKIASMNRCHLDNLDTCVKDSQGTHEKHEFFQILIFSIITVMYILLVRSLNYRMNMSRNLEKEVAEKTKQLRELNRTLQKRVEEQVYEIHEKEHALLAQQRLAQMGEMLQMIAHQWRQPLNNLSVNVQLLTMKLSKGDIDLEWAKAKEDEILKNVRGLSQTISDFQDYFSPTKEIQEFDLKTLADDTVHVIQHHIDKYNIQVNNQIQKDLSILGYRGEVGQALLVIITNAKDQFEQLQCEERKIDLLSRVEGENVSITVCDTAGGIPDDVMPKIFDPYFTTKGDLNGAGIGLYMVKMMIEQSLKGKVKAYNNDKGACFEIMLPMGGVNHDETM